MARTTLLRAFRRRLLEAGTPETDVAALASRRQLLAGGGAALAAFALPAAARAASSPRIAIVGGGIAGLTCALTLAGRGIAATVYEAGARVGGRMYSNRNWVDGQVSEWGGELIDTGHTTIRRLARRFGLHLDRLLEAQPPGSADVVHFDGAYYSKRAADRDFARIYQAVRADERAAPFPTRFDRYTQAAYVLDHMSVRDWIETRVPGGVASPLGQLLDTAYAIEYAADTTDQSALNLLYLLAYQPDHSGQTLAVFGVSDEAFHIRGGNDRLPAAIAAHLGDAVQKGMRLRRLARTAGGDYRLSFDVTGGGSDEVIADWVVLALPFAVLRGLDTAEAGFDARKRLAIDALGRGVSAKLVLQFNSRPWVGSGPWPGHGNGSSYADTGYQATWETSRAQPGASGLLTVFSGGSIAAGAASKRAFAGAGDPLVAADTQLALSQLEPVLPGVAGAWNGRATQSLWHLNPLARASYSYYRVGQYTAFAGHEGARQGRVLFCGEHTSTDFQGFMEGGASEGRRAAAELAGLIGGGNSDGDDGF